MKTPINNSTTLFLEQNVCNSNYFTLKFLKYTNELRNELAKLLDPSTVQLSIEWAWIPLAADPDGDEIEVFVIIDGEFLTDASNKKRFEVIPYAVHDLVMDDYSPKILAESILTRMNQDADIRNAKCIPNS